MAHFLSFLLGQGPEIVLKTASLDRFQKQLAVPADVGLTSGYGVGFQVERRENYVAFGHGGAVAISPNTFSPNAADMSDAVGSNTNCPFALVREKQQCAPTARVAVLVGRPETAPHNELKAV